jgi:RNA polymerase sigma-70 factor (ECF subfamily)
MASVDQPQKAAQAGIEAAWREHRGFAVDLAFRMLGDITEAEDVVQEAFARLMLADVADIADVRGWLVVVVSRLCLDILRSARVRRQVTRSELEPDYKPLTTPFGGDPADRVTLDDSVHAALLVVLEQLTPAERTSFTLHDVFGYQFETISTIVGRSVAACRQLAARARRRVETETGPARFAVPPEQHRVLTERFIAACSGGDLTALMQLLDPNVSGGIDADQQGRPLNRRGARIVARTLLRYIGSGSGVTLVSNPLPGELGVLAFVDGHLLVAFQFEIEGGRISHIDAFREAQKIDGLARSLGVFAASG